DANLVELTLPADSSVGGTQISEIRGGEDASPVKIIPGNGVLPPHGEETGEPGHEPLFVAAQPREEQLEALLQARR
ncbi:potassium transporter TrkA, partial [Streptomyces sp. XY533]